MKMTFINSLSKKSFSGSCSAMLQLLLITILLLAVGTAKAQIDSAKVNNDTVAWNKSLEGVHNDSSSNKKLTASAMMCRQMKTQRLKTCSIC